jgi:hypothetical protein
MELKYQTDRKQGPTVITVLTIIGLLFFFSSPNVHFNDPWVIGLCVLYFLIVIDLYWGTYIIINDSGLYAVDFFFYRNGLKFDQIQGIYYHPTWIMGSKARTLSITGSTRRRSVRLGTNHFYSLRTIAAIISEIKKRNPRVELDESAQGLIDKQ